MKTVFAKATVLVWHVVHGKPVWWFAGGVWHVSQVVEAGCVNAHVAPCKWQVSQAPRGA